MTTKSGFKENIDIFSVCGASFVVRRILHICIALCCSKLIDRVTFRILRYRREVGAFES